MPATIRVQLDDARRARDAGIDDVAALRRLLARSVRATLRSAKLADAELSITLIGDDAIAAMNLDYLGHEGPTDVLSFALYDEGEPVFGDVYVGIEQAARQAAQNGVPLTEELVRLTVHGVLHVLGHDHADGAERVDSQMWRLQEAIVEGVVRG